MATIHFHTALQQYTNNVKQHTFEVKTYLDALQACISLFPDFDRFIRSFISGKNKHEEIVILVDNKILDLQDICLPISKNKKVVIVPLLYGRGRNLGTFLAIAAIVSIAVFAPQLLVATSSHLAFTGTALTGAIFSGAATVTGLTTLGSIALGAAISLTLSALTSAPSPNIASNAPPDAGLRRNNDIFDGLTNPTSTNSMVPLTYGHNRVAGNFISGYVKTINHGKDDIVRVQDQI